MPNFHPMLEFGFDAMDETDLAVSIIVPVHFNDISIEELRLFRRAIESIADQDFPGPFEVLVVDDSPQPVSSYAEVFDKDIQSSIRWIRSHPRGGLVHALNTGLNQARYPLIARLDADDRWCPGKIEEQLSLLANDPDLSIVGTGMSLVHPDGEIFERLIRPGDWTGILRFFVKTGCPFPHGSIVARRDVFRLLGGYSHDPVTAHCEDFALWGTWLRFFKPAMIEKLLYEYTVSPTAKSAVNKDELARASGLVHGTFTRLNLVDRLPAALTNLAEVLGISLLQAGVLAYRMWHYRVPVHLPHDAIGALRTILCDKDVYVLDDRPENTLELDKVLNGFLSPKPDIPQRRRQNDAAPRFGNGRDRLRSMDHRVLWVN
jgi:glycosyltransferase involved in cell wall biosynthesis